MENLGTSLTITVIGMTVIFTVLATLWVTIIVLDKALPYREPAPEPVPADGVDAETVAVIQAAITKYLRRKPSKITIKPLK